MKHYKLVQCLPIFSVSSPPAETQSPPIENFLATVLLRSSKKWEGFGCNGRVFLSKAS